MRIKPAIKITLIYLIVASLWIYLSDELMVLLFDFTSKEQQKVFSIIKGFFYVIVTSLLLYKLIVEFYRSIDDKIDLLQKQQKELVEIQRLAQTGLWEYIVASDSIIWSSVTKEIFEVPQDFSPTPDILLNFLKREDYKDRLRPFMEEHIGQGLSFDIDFEITTTKGKHKWLRAIGTPLISGGKCIKVYGSYQDITETKLASEKIEHTNRLYEFITAVNDLVIHAENELELYQGVGKVAVEIGNFKLVWVAKVNMQTHEVVGITSEGLDEGYFGKAKEDTSYIAQQQKETFIKQLKNNEIIVCNNILQSDLPGTLKNRAVEHGFNSFITLPVNAQGKLFSFIVLYSVNTNSFDDNEVKLLKDAVANVSYAIANMENEKQKMLAEAKMKEALDRYTIVSKASRDTIWDWDIKNDTIIYNQGMHDIFGYPVNKITDKHEWLLQNIHPDDHERVLNLYQESFDRRRQIIQTEYRYRCSDGSYKYIVDRSFVKYDNTGAPLRAIGAMQDITTEREQEQKIQKAVIETQEHERQQMGMELHDNINQILSASMLYLGMLKDKAAEGKFDKEGFGRVEGFIREAINEIRRLSHRLAPVSIRSTPLRLVFDSLIKTMNVEGTANVYINIDSKIKEELPGNIKVALYRILQEQMNNIIKYAKATRVDVGLEVNEENLVFSVKDNGVGFDAKERLHGIGMENIKRRSALLHGSFNIKSEPGKGCEVIVKIPLKLTHT